MMQLHHNSGHRFKKLCLDFGTLNSDGTVPLGMSTLCGYSLETIYTHPITEFTIRVPMLPRG